MKPEIVNIHVKLLNEGTETVRRALAKKIRENAYQIIQPDNYDASDEEWEFLPGSIVRCENIPLGWKEPLFLAVEKVGQFSTANEGQIFAWNDPPPTGHPGEDFGCRCTAEPYVQEFLPNDPSINDPPLEDVYPEAVLIPLLKIPRLIIAWRLWILQRNLSKTWKLGKHKSAQKWANRMEKGNWTPDKISETIRNGEAHNAPNNVNRPNTATRYELGNDFVVVDDVTKEVLQVSEPGYLPKELQRKLCKPRFMF